MTDDQTRSSAPGAEESVTRRMPALNPTIENRISPTFSSDSDDEFEPSIASTTDADDDSSSVLWEITETLVLALLIFLAVRTVVLNFRVDGLSMEPTLNTGEMLLVNRQIYSSFDANAVLNILPFVEREGDREIYPFHPPQRGDIVVFDPPIGAVDKPYIKRVIGLPGETVAIRDGAVFVNNERLPEDYLGPTATRWPGRPDDFELLVPPDHVFVLGDNRNNSTDSRSFGPVEYDAIIGRAWIAYWPFDLFGIFQTPSYAP